MKTEISKNKSSLYLKDNCNEFSSKKIIKWNMAAWSISCFSKKYWRLWTTKTDDKKRAYYLKIKDIIRELMDKEELNQVADLREIWLTNWQTGWKDAYLKHQY